MGITCEPILNVQEIMQPLMMSAVLKGEEVPLDAFIDVYLQDAIVNSLLQNIELPPDFQDLGSVICLQLEMNKVKTLMDILKGKQPEETGIDKVIELVVNLQILSAIANAFGGTTTTTTTTTS